MRRGQPITGGSDQILLHILSSSIFSSLIKFRPVGRYGSLVFSVFIHGVGTGCVCVGLLGRDNSSTDRVYFFSVVGREREKIVNF
jgi:hypothetical protein